MRLISILTATILIFIGCSEQRDIYTIANPALLIEGDWEPSLHTFNMSMNATAMIYNEDGKQIALKKYFVEPNSVVVPLTKGKYNILLFNGLMYSEYDTHLDGVFFSATDHLNTFEANSTEAPPNNRLTTAPGEYIASNDMEILTSAYREQEMKNDVSYHIKYKNGKNGFPSFDDYIEESILMTPFAVSYECKVVVTLVNASSAYIANGALKGFVGSVFMASRMPSHKDATHQFRLNSFKTVGDPNDDIGTIESPVFVTFGPPLDIPNRKYTLEISIILINGDVFNREIDITNQILPVIDKIKTNLNAQQPIEIDLTIPVEIKLTLPIVDRTGNIDVDDWGDDEIIKVPIGRK